MRLSRGQLAGLLPHAGDMVLLHEVTHYDERSISCLAVSHRDTGNPLRENGRLHAICALEYAAQAMALHGALLDNRGARDGLLAAVREVELHIETLDGIDDDLTISAHMTLGENGRMGYDFEVGAGERTLIDGRAIVVLGQTPR